MLFAIGFQMLFGRALPIFERVFPVTLMIFGVYLMLCGLLLLAVYLWGMVALNLMAAAPVALICALIVLVGERTFAKGKEAWPSREKHEKKVGPRKDKDMEVLLKALGDEDTNVRISAIWALGETRDARAVEPLSQALKDKNERVQKEAAEALKKIRESKNP